MTNSVTITLQPWMIILVVTHGLAFFLGLWSQVAFTSHSKSRKGWKA